MAEFSGGGSSTPIVGLSDTSSGSLTSSLEKTPSRKRKKNVDNWKKSKRKRLRNSGQEYTSTRKQTVGLLCCCTYEVLLRCCCFLGY